MKNEFFMALIALLTMLILPSARTEEDAGKVTKVGSKNVVKQEHEDVAPQPVNNRIFGKFSRKKKHLIENNRINNWPLKNTVAPPAPVSGRKELFNK